MEVRTLAFVVIVAVGRSVSMCWRKRWRWRWRVGGGVGVGWRFGWLGMGQSEGSRLFPMFVFGSSVHFLGEDFMLGKHIIFDSHLVSIAPCKEIFQISESSCSRTRPLSSLSFNHTAQNKNTATVQKDAILICFHAFTKLKPSQILQANHSITRVTYSHSKLYSPSYLPPLQATSPKYQHNSSPSL